MKAEDAKRLFAQWLGRNMQIVLTDGRCLVGQFLCTDNERNVILGSAQEYVDNITKSDTDPRVLGLAMVPGRHIVSIKVDLDHVS